MMSTRSKLNLLSIVFILVAAASWVLNVGWLRVILTLFLAPVFHAVLFFVGNHFCARYIPQNKWLKLVTGCSYVTYLLLYLLLPDFGDVRPGYLFFHLIENDMAASVCMVISEGLFFLHIAILVMQYVLCFLHRSKQKRGLI